VSFAALDAAVAILRRPATYPEKPRAVEAIETHFSWVFLTDRHAYKLKKPIRYDSLDFSAPELRRRDCHEEVRLNRRLARGVYLGVVTLTREPDGALALEGAGEPIDWLVWMQRLPADRMLDVLIVRGAVAERDVRLAAFELAKFFAGAPPVEITAAGYRDHLERGVRSDRRELCRPDFGLPADRVAAIADRQLALLDRCAALFAERVREGRIIEGHGDLRPEHICLVAQPAIIDCLEFARELRIADPADELAFLALECERLGEPAVGGWFLDIYTEVSGDDPPPEVIQFYRNYRALRRALIAVRHLEDPAVRGHDDWRARAGHYLSLADPVVMSSSAS
jgi:aminoglycoside phosphotransferase family enzyme